MFDYHYLVNDEYIELLVRKPDGEEWELEVEKEFEEDLGLEFENSLMDEYCSWQKQVCVFCFIDQMLWYVETSILGKMTIPACLFFREIM